MATWGFCVLQTSLTTTLTAQSIQGKENPAPILPASVRKEIQNVAERRCLALVDFRITTAGARHGRELLVLDIEDLGKRPASSAEFVDFEITVTALGTTPVLVVHIRPLS